MSNRYASMRAFGDDLDRLCALCGLETASTAVPKTSKAVEIIEWVFRDDSLQCYLHEMRVRIRKAIKQMEVRQVELWDMQENEKYTEELEEQNQALRDEMKKQDQALRNELDAQSQKMQEQIRALETELESSRAQEMQAKSRTAMLQIELQEQKGECVLLEEKLCAREKELAGWIQGMIAMCDRMQASLEWALDSEPANEDAVKLLRMQLREAGQLLQKAGVEILDQDNVAFDPVRHVVKGVRPTADAEQAGTVACTCRPGYVFRGEMLRGQEVFVWQLQEDANLIG